MAATSQSLRESAAAWLAALPDDADSVRSAVAPFLAMTPDERLKVLSQLVASQVALAGDRALLRYDDIEPLWPRWKDALIGGRRA